MYSVFNLTITWLIYCHIGYIAFLASIFFENLVPEQFCSALLFQVEIALYCRTRLVCCNTPPGLHHFHTEPSFSGPINGAKKKKTLFLLFLSTLLNVKLLAQHFEALHMVYMFQIHFIFSTILNFLAFDQYLLCVRIFLRGSELNWFLYFFWWKKFLWINIYF